MSDNTLARVFEPFFTTKEVGKGTGLGLSMVYGFVKQSSGHLRIESSLGCGTTVNLYLPRFVGAVIRSDPGKLETTPGAAAGEVISVVEDDAGVRAYSAGALRELGYEVIEAEDGDAALQHLEGDERIDLVFSDVVLAGTLTGRDVGEVCQLLRPHTPVLFTSGYARDAISHNSRLDASIKLLAKPFNFSDLTAKVQSMIERRGSPLSEGSEHRKARLPSQPRGKWVIQDVPELRIVDQDSWEVARRRQRTLTLASGGTTQLERRNPTAHWNVALPSVPHLGHSGFRCSTHYGFSADSCEWFLIVVFGTDRKQHDVGGPYSDIHGRRAGCRLPCR